MSVAICGVLGCGYHLGFRPRAGIKSVAIPMAENRTLRRELEFPLTEAVVREVQRRTPLAVTSPDRADATLLIEIERFTQEVLVEDRRDEVLESSATIAVGVTGRLRSGETLFAHHGPAGRPGPGGPALLVAMQFAEGHGEALARPTSEAFREIAEQIVMLLEEGLSRPPAAAGTRSP